MAQCGYCQDCKWWRVIHPAHGGPEEPHRACELASTDRGEGRLMYAVGYASIGTAPDFGCVQWEAE